MKRQGFTHIIALMFALSAIQLVSAQIPESENIIEETSVVTASGSMTDSLYAMTDSLAPVTDQYIKRRRRINLYDEPYSPTLSSPNWGRLMVNTGVLIGGGITTLVVLENLPEEATAWSRSEQKKHSMWERYRKHFKEGPVWDGDKFVFNCILHPYGGAAYYMGARSCGFNIWGSFLYSFCVSTFFWEYGVECFMEVPSVQDLIVTPVVGSIFGEAFYIAKRAILKNNYRLLGSKALGYIVAFLLDPLNEVTGYFRGDQKKWCREHEKPKAPAFSMTPHFQTGNIGFTLSCTF